MRYLILSDIHANLEALEAVIADAAGAYDEVLCLGDIVGYGPDPNAVSDWVRRNCSAVIRGNHDKAAIGLDDLRFFNPVARAAAEWTRDTLDEDHRTYLRELPMGPLQVDHFQLVHGAPSNEDVYLITVEHARPQLEAIGAGVVFFGHTHLQGGFLRQPTETQVKEIAAVGIVAISAGEAVLVNPGSVGQPRDEQWKAAYVIYDTETNEVEYCRTPYDLAATQQKIVSAGLPSLLAERLSVGR